MTKELKALKSIKFGCCNFENRTLYYDEFNIIEKALKALAIIKNKKVDVLELSTCANYETYFAFFKRWNWDGEYDDYVLTKEEYDFLKEMLGNE